MELDLGCVLGLLAPYSGNHCTEPGRGFDSLRCLERAGLTG